MIKDYDSIIEGFMQKARAKRWQCEAMLIMAGIRKYKSRDRLHPRVLQNLYMIEELPKLKDLKNLDCSGLTFEQEDFRAIDLGKAIMDNCKFFNCKLNRNQIDEKFYCDFYDCEFEQPVTA